MAAGEATALFEQLDADKSGTLDKDELWVKLAMKGDDFATQMIDMVDLNGDGVVDLEEFLAAFEGNQAFRDLMVGPPVAQTAPSDLRPLELQVLAALAAARADPEACAKRIQRRLAHYKGKTLTTPTPPGVRAVPKETKEGPAAVKDALAFLKKQPSLPGFRVEQVGGLQLAAADHVADIGRAEVGVASHEGSDGNHFNDRQKRYGAWTGAAGECLWYGRAEPWVTGESLVDDLIVDDGVPSRGHRLAVFDERYNLAGVAVASHAVFSHMAAIEFANDYADDASAVAAREAAGPPVIQVLDGVRTGEKATQWKLGGCKGCGQEIRGGKVIEVGGGKWHADCFCCGRGGGEGFVAKHPGCGTAIGGEIKFKKEGKQFFCRPCWVEDFAPTCFVCGKKIADDNRTGKKGADGTVSYRHNSCKPTPGKKSGGAGKAVKKGKKKSKEMGFGIAKGSLESMGDAYAALAM